MTKNKLKILIVGETATGKTTIANLIYKSLKDKKLDVVELIDPDLENLMSDRKLEKNILSLIDKETIIEIEQIQLNRKTGDRL